MTLSEKEIRHIAHLARLQLTDKEIKQYRTELGGILHYVDQLQKLSLPKNVFPDQHISIETNLRSDQAVIWPETETDSALQQAPNKKDKQIKVQRILD